MKIDRLIDALQESRDHGAEDVPVLIFDPDMEEWMPITCFTISSTDIKLYSDDMGG